MPTLTEQQRGDLSALADLVAAISRLLAWLTESRMIPSPLKEQSFVVLRIAQSHMHDAITRIGEVANTEDTTWRRLNEAGLVGEPLQLKVAIWQTVAAVAPARSVPRVGKVKAKILKPILKLANSVLGSLLKAFPLLDIAKEYKDGVEAVIDLQRTTEDPPRSILKLR
jgi:hypothetical protein